ncbi:pilus assembly protein CpaD, partial [Agrobacterium vitis]|nr:pilus assembly protein CpaD [Agrobacterium vitis]
TDLIAPRGMTPIDAERRSTVIDNYRDGKDTSTTTSTD